MNEKGNKKYPYISLGMRIVGGDFDDVYISSMVSLSPAPGAVKNLKKLLEAATGREWDGEEELEVDDDDSVPILEGAVVGGFLTTNVYQGNENTVVRMNSWVSEEIMDDLDSQEEPF